MQMHVVWVFGHCCSFFQTLSSTLAGSAESMPLLSSKAGFNKTQFPDVSVPPSEGQSGSVGSFPNVDLPLSLKLLQCPCQVAFDQEISDEVFRELCW